MNLSAIVSYAIETMKRFLGSRQIDLVVDMGSNPLWVEADYYRFTQVTANILHNAAKYTAPCARVAVRVREEGTDAVVSIRDAGKGIPETLLPYIFDLFVQGDQSLSRTEAGLGIGLTLARSIVGLHNGSVVAESAGLGQGSEFIVRIPLANPPQETLPPSSETAAGQPSIGLRILVVDDNLPWSLRVRPC